MNSNIYYRKKHSYKNRPYYCPINNMWFYPYMYMNPYISHMTNPFMASYMEPYMNAYYGNVCSYKDRAQCGAARAYGEDNYGFTKRNIYPKQYEKEVYRGEENKKRFYEEDSLDDIVIFNEGDNNEHIEKEKKLDKAQEKIYDSDLESAFIEKREIQLEKINKEAEVDESKEKEPYRGIKINMRKVPLKEITD
ncbi:hypothetical protein FDG42_01610 [Clostridium botulinum]|uniref:hypothetical protein n=1 Tax=Clostridium botulinum TaxID=1491 RepID=UPI0013F09370|nr:hypothetical protein [Clostridium botulinum]MCW6070423.1 hypothetical protein [Clostridium botulinum]MCW6081508.1 hypothetical protein [Clostridium botulinum]MCW6095762.1 hypothetical protein [Clostridium botulinum]NFH09664.1 hypothetical protein [Clostridium botulinum]NFL99412.1 hypothetical protein [Clostridium botulinum]